MDEPQDRENNLIDTTDCLEAIGVFRSWKNFLFTIAICSLLVLQISFWLVNTGYIKAKEVTKSQAAVVSPEQESQIVAEVSETQETADKPAPSLNQPTKALAEEPPKKTRFVFDITFAKLALVIRFFNFLLIPVSILYCLTMLFSLKVSLLGRLGGINHISRAFFLSLAFVVLLLPWQKFFGGVVAGAMYSPEELLSSYTDSQSKGIFSIAFYYLRFTGYWVLVVLLLMLSQMRSFRWAKTILRRLEII